MTVSRYRAFWSIPNAGPAVSTFHADAVGPTECQAFATRARTFLFNLAAKYPNEVSISFDTEVTTHDVATGQLLASTTVLAPPLITGTSTGTWAAGSGARVVWGTNSIVAGRRVRGSTFLVPLTAASFDANGRVAPGAITDINVSAGAFISGLIGDGAPLMVFSKPVLAQDGSVVRPGSVHTIQNGLTSGLAASLRTRKY